MTRIYKDMQTGVSYYHANPVTVKGVNNVVVTACVSVIMQGNAEQFVCKDENGRAFACNLKTLNSLVNELHQNIKVLASCNHDSNTTAFSPVRVFWY